MNLYFCLIRIYKMCRYFYTLILSVIILPFFIQGAFHTDSNLLMVHAFDQPLHKEFQKLIDLKNRRLVTISLMDWFKNELDLWISKQHIHHKIKVDHLKYIKLKKSMRQCNDELSYHKQSKHIKDMYVLLRSEELLDLYQSIGPILVIKSAFAISNQAVLIIMEMLDLLYEYHVYWQEQERYPWRYIFHRSPLKWFEGVSYKCEIKQNKKVIEQIFAKYTVILGRLMCYIHTFDSLAGPQDQCEWVNKLLDIVAIMSGQSGEIVSSSDDILCKIIKRYVRQSFFLQQHKKKILVLIENSKKPSHIIRFWFWYGIIVCSVVYGYLDPHSFFSLWFNNKAIDGYKTNLYKMYKDRFFDPANNFIKTCQGVDEDGQEFFQGEIPSLERIKFETGHVEERIDSLEQELQVITNQLNKYQKKDAIESGVSLEGQDLSLKKRINQYKKNIENRIDLMVPQVSAQERQAIVQEIITEGQVTLLSTHMNGITKGTWSLATGSELFTQEGYAKVLQIAESKVDSLLIPLMHEVVALKKDLKCLIAQKNKGIIETELSYSKDIVGSAKLINEELLKQHVKIDSITNMVNQLLREVNKLLRENKLLLRMLTLIPAGGTVFVLFKSIKKVYDWLTRKDYRELREALCEVEKIIIKSSEVMSYEIYGRLVYLLHKLRIHALKTISKNNDVQHQFIIDVQELESYDFTPREKEKLISLMRKRYDFLKN